MSRCTTPRPRVRTRTPLPYRRSVGCVLAELLGRKPLFPHSSVHDQLRHVVRTLGSPTLAELESMTGPTREQARQYVLSLPPAAVSCSMGSTGGYRGGRPWAGRQSSARKMPEQLYDQVWSLYELASLSVLHVPRLAPPYAARSVWTGASASPPPHFCPWPC